VDLQNRRETGMSKQPRVVVAMSGGVDSSVAAALLKQQGYEVIGMMMRLWNEPGAEGSNRCCTPDAMAQARRVAAKLEIPFYAIDAQEIFYQHVVKYFVNAYAQYITPNPCLNCNRYVRWEFLLQHAQAIGADFMATGHYVRLEKDAANKIQILAAVDRHKDQSYVLHILNQEQLAHALFPLGEFTKPQVRQIARDFDLPVAERAESQDLCFLGDSDYRQFLRRQAPEVGTPGPMITRDGKEIGQHQGLAFYTIGQRKGLAISATQPHYVLDKDPSKNTLIVGTLDQLGQTELIAGPINWISGIKPPDEIRLSVKIRYKAPRVLARIMQLPNNMASVAFDQPLRDITPGQAAVFYDGDACLGGGIIQPSPQWLSEEDQ